MSRAYRAGRSSVRLLFFLTAVFIVAIVDGCYLGPPLREGPGPRPSPVEFKCRTWDGRVFLSDTVCRAHQRVLWEELVERRAAAPETLKAALTPSPSPPEIPPLETKRP